ncbi:hypothetical protein ACFTAO_10375 [Paenibacillus rhizoplanae]
MQQTSTAVGNQTVQEMLSSGPNGLYSKLRKQGIPTTLTDDEVKAANSVNLRMQAEGTRETGTVWDNIKRTQPNNPGTSIPKSFEVTVNEEKVLGESKCY